MEPHRFVNSNTEQFCEKYVFLSLNQEDSVAEIARKFLQKQFLSAVDINEQH